MSKAGQYNFKGITYQAQAALLLFLLRLREGGFESITLEDPKWEDFTLNYTGSKKIICESKNHRRPLGVGQVKTILQNVIDREDTVNEKDEILIICTGVTHQLSGNLEYIKYFPQTLEKYRQLGFSDEQLGLLSKTSFFIATSSDFLYQEASAYLYSYIGYWLPQSEIDGLLDSVLVKQIYTKSTRGETFTRAELSDAIEKYRNEKIKSGVIYDKDQTAIEQQMKTVLQHIRSGNTGEIKRALTDLTAQPQMLFIVIEKITDIPGVKLSDWGFLWEALLDRQYAFRVLHSFEDKHIQDKENASYMLELFTANMPALTKKTVDKFHAEFVLGTARKILKEHPDLEEQVFTFCEAFLAERGKAYFGLEDKAGSSHEKQLVSEILFALFELYIKSNLGKIQKLLELVDAHFNLVDDDGDQRFFIFTPRPIFDLLAQYIKLNFKNNFPEVKNLLVNQFKQAKYYGNDFKGWELMGGTLSQLGSDYSIGDRHFITFSLKPAFAQYYTDNPELGWRFIVDECVTRRQTDISKDRPDFLNRAAVTILLTEYGGTNHSEEAFNILKDFILMPKGIPAKSEVVFYEMRDNTLLSDDKKWALVQVFLEKYKLPITVFVEQITSELALRNNKEALRAIRIWVSDPKYREQQNRRSFLLGENMLKLLDSPQDSDAYKTGLEILKAYINSSDYQQKLDTFDAYNVTDSIAKVLTKNEDVGIQLLWDIYGSGDNLTTNQQIAVTHPLIKLSDPVMLLKVFDRFVKPVIFDKLQSDNNLIEASFSNNYARELLAQFAEKLAEAKIFDQALELVRVLIKDKNPSLENEPEDPNGTFNYHAKIMAGEDCINISTVRGWCAWTFTKFNVIEGRKYIPEVVELVGTLAKDPNLYVRIQATLPLSGLTRNRHTVMPKDDKERFISLELAQRIEDIIFAMLRDEQNQTYPLVLKHLIHPINGMRSVPEEEAWEILNTYKDISFEQDFDDIYSLFVFFALFRKEAFRGEQFKAIFGDALYEKINRYDEARFITLLEDLIQNGSDDARGRIAWQFWQLPKEGGSEFEEMFDLSTKYLTEFTKRYSKHSYDEIYYFINDNIEQKPRECIDLWLACIDQERAYLEAHADELRPGEWWPNHYNSAVLDKIKEVDGDEAYLKAVEALLDYPDKFDNGVDANTTYAHLKRLTESGNSKAIKLKKKLSDQYPRLYDDA